MRFRSAGRLSPDDVGHRVTVRMRNADGSASDVIGILTVLDGAEVRVAPAEGPEVRVPIERIVAARRVGRPFRRT